MLSLFGEWFCVHEWGRIGSPGEVRSVAYASQVAAQAMLDRQLRRKERRGYVRRPVRAWFVPDPAAQAKQDAILKDALSG